jgi:hypothetical protein
LNYFASSLKWRCLTPETMLSVELNNKKKKKECSI